MSPPSETAAAGPRPGPGTAAGAGEFHIPSLDGLRAIAVLIVFFSHVGLNGVMPGGLGVTIFFFLSGFLITTLMRIEWERTGRISMRKFYLRRVLRIFPPMYLSLAFAVLCTWLVGRAFSSQALTLQAVHLTNYYKALGGNAEPLGTEVMWSLAVEEHFYLLFPLAFVALRTRVLDSRRSALVLLAACGVLLGWRTFEVLGLHLPSLYTMHATDTRIDSILLGCVLALWGNPAVPGPRLPAKVVWSAFVVGLAVLGSTLVVRGPVFRETIRYTLQGLALVPVFVAAVSYPRALVFRFLGWPVMKWIGLFSYSLYLVHLPIILVLEQRFHLRGAVLLVLSLALSIGLSALMYFTIEKPCAQLRRKLSRTSLMASPGTS